MLLVESSTSAVSQSSKSNGKEQKLSVTANTDDVISLSSLSELTDVSDVKRVDGSQGDRETECLDHSLLTPDIPMMSEHMLTSEHVASGGSVVDTCQQTDSDVCEKLVLLSNGDEHICDAVDQLDARSQRQSDVSELSAVNVDAATDSQISTSSSKYPYVTTDSILSHTDQSKQDHSVISSSLKNISQNEDQDLVYIVFSKSSSVQVFSTR